MSSNADFFLKKTLGNDFMESLQKVELWKPGTRTTIDHEEIRTALHIVPRTLMSMLIRELTPMQIGESKEIEIPCEKHTVLHTTKHERDVYTGHVDQENKNIVDFKYRSVPGIGLVIMSALELYNVDDLNHTEPVAPNITEQVQKIIDERLAMHDLVNKIVDKKIAQKDAIQQLILTKLTEAVSHRIPEKHEEIVIGKEMNKGSSSNMKAKKVSPLSSFLEQRKSKSSPKKEFSIELAKGEHVNCSDCGGNIFDGQIFSGCICVGDDMDKKVYLKKTEAGIKVRFSKGWDSENIEMLLEMLRRKNG